MTKKKMGMVDWLGDSFTITVDVYNPIWLEKEAPFAEYIHHQKSLGGYRWQVEYARLINIHEVVGEYQLYEESPENEVTTLA